MKHTLDLNYHIASLEHETYLDLNLALHLVLQSIRHGLIKRHPQRHKKKKKSNVTGFHSRRHQKRE
jgi:hypothetical protein